jgi:hypothetical protein
MIVAEYYLQWAINQGLKMLSTDIEHLEDILDGLSMIDTAKYQQAQQFYTQNVVPVIQGWPDQDIMRSNVVIAITVSPRRESDDFIGGDIGSTNNYDTNGNIVDVTVRQGMNTSVTYNVTVYGVNQDLVIWTSNIVWWSLMQFRVALTENGFMTQKLSQADATLDPRFQGQSIFRRITTFTALVQDAVSIQYSTVLKHIYVEAIDPEDEQHPYLPND